MFLSTNRKRANTVVDGDMSVGKANLTATQVEEQVKKEFDEVTETKVRMEPPKPSIRN
ncbi:MAG: cation transporter dimerization domain-containing protein [Candidatus Bathyarchaeia archaeon]